MPKSANSHNENRAKVCSLCFQKHPLKNMRSTDSPVNLKSIKEFFIETYCPLDLKMPSGICTSCKTKLQHKEDKKLEVSFPNFSKLHFPPTTVQATSVLKKASV